ncbi:MAG: NAD-dependent epimerase/dehydratase family protein [Clostridiales bacterium]|nr:NAD-dependent epimerase/dehydratase family protein [Clostridiales bacterium]
MTRSVLFIGGSGIISTAVVTKALEKNWAVTLLNRGTHSPPAKTAQIVGDITLPQTILPLIQDQYFDVVCDFFTFTPQQAQERIALFANRCSQYIFISSATVYQKPPATFLMTECTPKKNPFSLYAQNKIACEEVFLQAYVDADFPVTIVRPSYTYGNTSIPWVLNSRDHRYSFIHRMKQGKPIVIPGDGTTFFTLTHNSDFAYAFEGLMGNTQAIGHAFHITSSQAMTWDGYLQVIAKQLHIPCHICHLTSEQICTQFPEEKDALLGDKSQTALFDLSKITTFVPSYVPRISFEEGIKQTLAYHHAHPDELMGFDPLWDQKMDALINTYS